MTKSTILKLFYLVDVNLDLSQCTVRDKDSLKDSLWWPFEVLQTFFKMILFNTTGTPSDQPRRTFAV